VRLVRDSLNDFFLSFYIIVAESLLRISDCCFIAFECSY
jgi:hypothetical protein